MGIAEVIPGVSGGTIAFITGIYEDLLMSIKAVDADLIRMFFTGKWKACFEKLNGLFLLFLFAGMLLGVVFGIFVVSYFLEFYPEPLWGFFFGLIAASVIYIGRQVQKINLLNVILFIVAAIGTYYITTITPSEGSEFLPLVFLSGAIAICALILPGISGSFILLLLGMYSIIIPNLKSLLSTPNSHSLMIVGVFILGCLTGLMLFSRILTYSFKSHKDLTLSAMTGIMLGSLNKIWPWRNPLSVLDKDTGSIIDGPALALINTNADHIKIIAEQNVLPAQYSADPMTMITIMALCAGVVFVLGFLFVEKED